MRTTGATAVESKAAVDSKLSDVVVGRGAWRRQVWGADYLRRLSSPLVKAYSAIEPL